MSNELERRLERALGEAPGPDPGATDRALRSALEALPSPGDVRRARRRARAAARRLHRGLHLGRGDARRDGQRPAARHRRGAHRRSPGTSAAPAHHRPAAVAPGEAISALIGDDGLAVTARRAWAAAGPHLTGFAASPAALYAVEARPGHLRAVQVGTGSGLRGGCRSPGRRRIPSGRRSRSASRICSTAAAGSRCTTSGGTVRTTSRCTPVPQPSPPRGGGTRRPSRSSAATAPWWCTTSSAGARSRSARHAGCARPRPLRSRRRAGGSRSPTAHGHLRVGRHHRPRAGAVRDDRPRAALDRLARPRTSSSWEPAAPCRGSSFTAAAPEMTRPRRAGTIAGLAASPDGRRIVLALESGGRTRVVIAATPRFSEEAGPLAHPRGRWRTRPGAGAVPLSWL